MKKFISIFITLALLTVSLHVTAETVINLDSLTYDEYMFGEVVTVTGSTNSYVNLALYYPEETGAGAKFIMTYSPAELRDGIEIQLGEQSPLWPEGTWTIIVQNGEVSDFLQFDLVEFADRTETPVTPPDKPATNPGNGQSVVQITPDKTKLTVKAGEEAFVNIATTASSLTLEVEDTSIITASVSGKVLKVKGLKQGTSAVWVKAGNNYASVNITVQGYVTEEPPTEDAADNTTEEPTDNTNEPAASPFTDIKGHWAEKAIAYLYNKGVVSGMTETTFDPNSPVTRAQFVTMLCKAFSIESQKSESPFNDVVNSHWYFPYVIAAWENGIAKGDYSGNFNPNSLITRQDMATLAFRSAAVSDSGNISASPFADDSSIADYAKTAVYSMKSMGVINGMSETMFEPLGNATRAQAAQIIAKLLEISNN